MLECRSCDLLWLDPQPAVEDLGLLYAGYCTHAGTETQPRWGRLEPWIRAYLARHYGYGAPSEASWAFWHLLPGVQDLFGGVVNWLPFVADGKLLDVGCGNGELMRRMRGFGWDVMGVEPDRAAADVARREYGLDVRASVNEAPRASFDAVITHHVIEHVPDPVGFLESLASVCRPNARIVVVTPNARGLGARWFGASYVHLDPPRHVILFSAAESDRGCTTGRARGRTAPHIRPLRAIRLVRQSKYRHEPSRTWRAWQARRLAAGQLRRIPGCRACPWNGLAHEW